MKIDKICRMCSSEKARIKSIFEAYQQEQLLTIIKEVVQIDVAEGDGLPWNICKPCATTLIRIQANLDEFRENDRQLRSAILATRFNVDAEEGSKGVMKSELLFVECTTQTSPLEAINVTSTETSCEVNDRRCKSESISILDDNQITYTGPDADDTKESNNEIDINQDEVKVLILEALNIEEVNTDLISSADEESQYATPETFNIDLDIVKSETNFPCEAVRDSSDKCIDSESKPSLKAIGANRRAAASITGSKCTRKSLIGNDDLDRPKQNDHKCYICRSQSLGSAKALLEHLTSHADSTPYTCTECVMETVVVKSVRSLNYHLKMHAQPKKCQYCDRRYCDDRARDTHVKTFHLGESALCPSKCNECGKVCKSISALKSHMRDHRLDLPCKHCNKIFHRRNKLKNHIARVHEKAQRFECNLCNRVVHSLDSYNAHLKKHMSEKTYECDLCPMKFYTAGNLGLHKKIHIINANYKPHKDWSGHYTISQEPGQDKVYTCKLCGKSYTKTIMKINNHLKHHFKDVKCDRCDLKFVNESQLKAHYVVHTGVRQFKCEFCDKGFLHKNNLTQHMKLHRNEQNYACEFCGKLFTFKEGMKAHIRNHHLRESPYECSRCRIKFVDNASLDRHITAEHVPPQPPMDLGPPPIMGTRSTSHVFS